MESVCDSLLSEDWAGEKSWKSLPMLGIAIVSSRQGLDHQATMANSWFAAYMSTASVKYRETILCSY